MRSNPLTIFVILAGCAGGQKSGVNSAGGVPPPPKTNPAAASNVAAISTNARKDYQAALQYFEQNDKGTWNDSTCRSAASKFADVVRVHPELVAAQFMAGLSFHRCNLVKEAEQAYQVATRMKGDPNKQAMALSNLGQIYYRAGKVEGAKQYWESAIKANGKLVAARINLASLAIEKMRTIDNVKDGRWKSLEEDAKQNLSNALGVDAENVEAYTAYALLYMEGSDANKNRLLLAKLLLDEGKQRDPKFPPLLNAYGLYFIHRGSLNEALASFGQAVDGDPSFVEARVNAGLLTLGFRKYDSAKELFSKAVELQPKHYDAVIGLGIAMRGLKDFDGAEAQYKNAAGIDPRRSDSYYNLGVLYKDFRANQQNDPDPIKALRASQAQYRQAKDYFGQALGKEGSAADKAEAKQNMGDCDKVIKQLDKAIASLAAQPPPAAPSATP